MASFLRRLQDTFAGTAASSALSSPSSALSSASSALASSSPSASASPVMEKVHESLKSTFIAHPYFPPESPIAGYLANEYNTLELVSLFAAGCAVIFGCTFVTVKRVRPNLPVSDLAVILWFVLCGFIHLFFEGYYAWNFRTIGGHQDLFGQLWKEYALSDSRYLTADSAFVLCMESITAVSGGLFPPFPSPPSPPPPLHYMYTKSSMKVG